MHWLTYGMFSHSGAAKCRWSRERRGGAPVRGRRGAGVGQGAGTQGRRGAGAGQGTGPRQPAGVVLVLTP